METADLTFAAIRSVLKSIYGNDQTIMRAFRNKQVFLSRFRNESIEKSIAECDKMIDDSRRSNLLLYKNLDDSLVFSNNQQIRDFVRHAGGFTSTLNQNSLN